MRNEFTSNAVGFDFGWTVSEFPSGNAFIQSLNVIISGMNPFVHIFQVG